MPNFNVATIDPEAIAAWDALPVAERAEKSRDWIQRYVINWDELRKHPRVGDLDFGQVDESEPRLFYLHIPKTGGTTLQYLIAKNYRIHGVLHVNAPDALRNPAVLYKKGHLPERAIMGHYHMAHIFYQALDQPFLHITMLREPVARVWSYYSYLRRRTVHPHHRKAMSRSFEDFAQSADMVELSNGQTLRLAGRPGFQLSDQSLPSAREMLSIAKDNLANRFSCFGLQDRYSEFLLMARQLLGWSDIFHRRHNASQRRADLENVDETTLEAIREKNTYDIELYEFANSLFEERCQQLRITRERVERYRQANKQYIELLSVPI